MAFACRHKLHLLSVTSVVRQSIRGAKKRFSEFPDEDAFDPKEPGFRRMFDSSVPVHRDLLKFIQQDIDLRPQTLLRWWRRNKYQSIKWDQRFLPERHAVLGPDLACAHFIVMRGGAVKFLGRDKWHSKSSDGKYYLPNRKVEELYLEAVNASGTNLMYTGLDNFIDLKHLACLNLSNCPFVDDWCMARLHQFQNSLEYLNISGCPRISERGLACLHSLEFLKAVIMENMPYVENKELLALLVEDSLPMCKVMGTNYADVRDNKNSTLV